MATAAQRSGPAHERVAAVGKLRVHGIAILKRIICISYTTIRMRILKKRSRNDDHVMDRDDVCGCVCGWLRTCMSLCVHHYCRETLHAASLLVV